MLNCSSFFNFAAMKLRLSLFLCSPLLILFSFIIGSCKQINPSYVGPKAGCRPLFDIIMNDKALVEAIVRLLNDENSDAESIHILKITGAMKHYLCRAILSKDTKLFTDLAKIFGSNLVDIKKIGVAGVHGMTCMDLAIIEGMKENIQAILEVCRSRLNSPGLSTLERSILTLNPNYTLSDYSFSYSFFLEKEKQFFQELKTVQEGLQNCLQLDLAARLSKFKSRSNFFCSRFTKEVLLPSLERDEKSKKSTSKVRNPLELAVLVADIEFTKNFSNTRSHTSWSTNSSSYNSSLEKYNNRLEIIRSLNDYAVELFGLEGLQNNIRMRFLNNAYSYDCIKFKHAVGPNEDYGVELYESDEDEDEGAVVMLNEYKDNICYLAMQREWSPIFAAVYAITPAYTEDFITSLINSGISLNAIDGKLNETPLHVAAEYSSLKCVKRLVEAGADKRLKNSLGETPLDVARKAGRSDIVNFLE